MKVRMEQLFSNVVSGIPKLVESVQAGSYPLPPTNLNPALGLPGLQLQPFQPCFVAEPFR